MLAPTSRQNLLSVKPVSIAVVGMSASRLCGVRDHAHLLAEALSRESVSYDMRWLLRREESVRGGRSETRTWTQELTIELDRCQPDAILLHYSVFAYSYRGLPIFVPMTLSALRDSQIPCITVLHEFAYPWSHGGLRGKIWALTQRAALVDVMRTSTAVIVTTDLRAKWLASRLWLPRRPIRVTPVFSNLPPPTAVRRPDSHDFTIGLFGYSYEGAAACLVLDAIRLLKDRGIHLTLMLLGAPGCSSAAAEAWLTAARTRDVAHALFFSGILSASDLSDALASCDVLLFADVAGPSSRKTTLAASLASGRPVVAIDGPARWSELVQSKAVEVVQRTPPALADAIGALLTDEGLRESLGARGRTFAEQRMSITRSAETVAMLLGDIVDGHAMQTAPLC